MTKSEGQTASFEVKRILELVHNSLFAIGTNTILIIKFRFIGNRHSSFKGNCIK
jgi:hypothetical protein